MQELFLLVCLAGVEAVVKDKADGGEKVALSRAVCTDCGAVCEGGVAIRDAPTTLILGLKFSGVVWSL